MSKQDFAAFLFDMDGTIIESLASAERVWSAWARLHGLDVATFLPTMHGARAVDTIRRVNLPGLNPAVEAEKISRAEIDDVEDVVPIPGAKRFLAALPTSRFAIVTSATRPLAQARLAAAGLTAPDIFVTAEDVTAGKPAPDGYRLAAERLGCDVRDCLVFEDAMAGIRAGEAAGAKVMVITAVQRHVIETPHPSIANYDQLSVSFVNDRLWLERTDQMDIP